MIKVWGHRGHRHDRFPEKYPGAPHENSLRAFEEALQCCSGLETDIILSKQKNIYLTHDTLFSDRVYYEFKTHLDEASQQIVDDRMIFQMENVDVSHLKLKDGQKLATLEELFALMPRFLGRAINLELKGPDTSDIALMAVEKAIAQNLVTAEQINFSGFNLPDLRRFREKIGSRFKIGALLARIVQDKTAMFPNWPDTPQDAFYMPFRLEQGIMENEDLKAIDPDYFNLEYASLTEAGVEAIDRFNPKAKIILWPAAEPYPLEDSSYAIEVIEKFAPTGKIYAVMSDFPEIFQRLLQEKGLAAAL